MAVGDISYVVVDPLLLTTSAVTIYTIPANNHLISAEIILCNITANVQEAKVHLIPSGGSASTANAIIYQDASTNLVDGESMKWNNNQFLEAGDFIQALNSNNTAVNIHISCILRATA